MNTILLLFLLFEVKHFICDGLLQTRYHLGKFKEKFKDYFEPLLHHSAINGVGVFLIAMIFIPKGSSLIPICLFMLEIILHFVIDRIKASPKLLGRWNNTEALYWHTLMLDQMIHRICYIAYISIIINVR